MRYRPFTTTKKLCPDIYGADYFDYLESSSPPDTAKITDIPWWQFANLSISIPDVDIVTINHALAEMHPQAVKTMFARLYSAWGDTDKKIVLAESLGYSYVKRKQAMFTDIRTGNFTVNRSEGFKIFRTNKISAAAQLFESSKTPSFTARTQGKVIKRVTNLIVRTFSAKTGQQLAKQIKHGPIHQSKVNTAIDEATQPLHDFFENLVSDERTPDEIFLKPRTGDIK